MQQFSFKALTREDLPLLTKWLESKFVQEWYGKPDSTPEGVIRKYLPRIEMTVPIRCFLIVEQDLPIGFIQTYWHSDFPSACSLDSVLHQKTASLDLFLSDASFTGKGIGSLVLRQFLEEIIFGESKAEACLVDPDPNNVRAVRAYLKVGFSPLPSTPNLLILTRTSFP